MASTTLKQALLPDDTGEAPAEAPPPIESGDADAATIGELRAEVSSLTVQLQRRTASLENCMEAMMLMSSGGGGGDDAGSTSSSAQTTVAHKHKSPTSTRSSPSTSRSNSDAAEPRQSLKAAIASPLTRGFNKILDRTALEADRLVLATKVHRNARIERDLGATQDVCNKLTTALSDQEEVVASLREANGNMARKLRDSDAKATAAAADAAAACSELIVLRSAAADDLEKARGDARSQLLQQQRLVKELRAEVAELKFVVAAAAATVGAEAMIESDDDGDGAALP
jgi:hypothetical protein